MEIVNSWRSDLSKVSNAKLKLILKIICLLVLIGWICFYVAVSSNGGYKQISLYTDIKTMASNGVLNMKKILEPSIFKGGELIQDNIIGKHYNVASIAKNRRYFYDLHEEQPGKAEVNVIIVTYMRSGATLLGDILQQGLDVFYGFEPLFSLERFIKMPKRDSLPILNLNKREIPFEDFKKSKVKRGILDAFLNCDFTKMDVHTLTHDMHQYSNTTRPYSQCLTKYPGLTGIFQCIHLLYNACKKSRVTMVKTTRTRMATVMDIMESNPKLKVVHLVGDPRGMLYSLNRSEITKSRSLRSYANDFCFNMAEDLVTSHVLKLVYPGRIQIVRYEDFAEKPLNMTQKLYDFLGLKLTPLIKSYVVNRTLGTSPAYLKFTSRSWREKIPIKNVLDIDKACASTVYSMIGYLPLNRMALHFRNKIRTHTTEGDIVVLRVEP